MCIYNELQLGLLLAERDLQIYISIYIHVASPAGDRQSIYRISITSERWQDIACTQPTLHPQSSLLRMHKNPVQVFRCFSSSLFLLLCSAEFYRFTRSIFKLPFRCSVTGLTSNTKDTYYLPITT